VRLSLILRESFSGFRRTQLAAIGSILTIAIALLLLGAYYVVSTNTSRLVHEIRSHLEMEAYLEEPVTMQGVIAVRERVLAIEGVDSVRYVSKKDAAEIFKQDFGEDINSVLEFNPLPPSFKVAVRENFRTPGGMHMIDSALRATKGIESVRYRRDVVEAIDQKSNALDALGLGIGILLSVSAIFLVSNTIRLTIDAKRRAVQTMKLVGASMWSVRAPFVVEGFLQGLIGGLVAAGITYYLLHAAVGAITGDLALFLRVEPTFYALVVAGGLLLGLFGSVISVRKFIGQSVGG
jgi:cell division transport system permease protein